MAERFYNEEEAQQILQMAARGTGGGGGLSESKLVETAAELGISAEEVYAAQKQFELERTEQADRIAFRQKLKKEAFGEFSQWCGVSIMLFGINFFTEGLSFRNLVHFWALWPVGMWGLVILSKSFSAICGMTFNFEPQFQAWRAEKLRKEAKKAEKAQLEMQSSLFAKEEDQNQTLRH
jgi:hypothetical protein